METEIIFKEISELLGDIKASEGEGNLLDHLSKMFGVKLLLNDDKKYVDLFEDISIRLKKNGKYLNDEEKHQNLLTFLTQYIENIKKEKTLLDPPMNKPEGEEEPTPITAVNYVADYYTLFQKLSWCGVSLGERESFLLTNSLRNLSAVLQQGQISFFGKIFGTEKDYYVAVVADIEPNPDFNYDADMEHRKEDGVNRDVFYVTNDLTEPWVELPDIKPSQVVASRKIRYQFTGDLKRVLYTNPHFNGQEQHYLHCQLARIYHGTKLVPSLNHYTIEDPENPFRQFVPNEKPKPFTHADLVNLKNWIHYPPSILKQGRVSHFIEPPEDADPEEFRKKEMEKDPFEKRIKPVSEDKELVMNSFSNIKICPWKLIQTFEDKVYTNPYIKLLDETQPDFDPLEQKDNKVDYTIICVKSLLWPGAYNFYLNKESYFFYFGDGLKFVDTQKEGPFVYKSFPILPKDFDDLPDQPEPTIPPKEEGEEGEEGEEENKEENKEGEQEPEKE